MPSGIAILVSVKIPCKTFKASAIPLLLHVSAICGLTLIQARAGRTHAVHIGVIGILGFNVPREGSGACSFEVDSLY
jgi:hypothetical protein